jgi:ABC-type uncharacterized transport system ATPase subunit
VAGFLPQRRQSDFLSRITLVMGQKQQLIWDLPPLDSLRVNAAIYGIPKQKLRFGAIVRRLMPLRFDHVSCVTLATSVLAPTF